MELCPYTVALKRNNFKNILIYEAAQSCVPIALKRLNFKNVSLDGAADGIRYYLTPQWHKLAERKVIIILFVDSYTVYKLTFCIKDVKRIRIWGLYSLSLI